MGDDTTETLKTHSSDEPAAPPGHAVRSAEEEAICQKLLRGEKLTHEELTLWLGEPPETFWPRFFASIRPWGVGVSHD